MQSIDQVISDYITFRRSSTGKWSLLPFGMYKMQWLNERLRVASSACFPSLSPPGEREDARLGDAFECRLSRNRPRDRRSQSTELGIFTDSDFINGRRESKQPDISLAFSGSPSTHSAMVSKPDLLSWPSKSHAFPTALASRTECS